MKALRCIICSALLCGSCNLASATRIPDADEWYGIHLGSRAPGQPDRDRAIARQTISLPVPKPWQWVFVNTDDAGRMCVLIFGDRGVDRWTDMPPGQIPKRIKSKQMMKADAAAVLAYATAKLGRPDKTGGDDRGSDERRFEWTRKDKAGVIRAASLSVSDEAIFLIINPSIGVTDTMELEPKPIEYEAGDCRGSSNTV